MAVNIGIIGYRNHAKTLIHLLEKNQSCNLTTIYHPSKKIDDSRITNNFDDLLKCDAIFIASPNHTHYPYIQKLEEFHGYIFCEKPPVTNVDELNMIENFSTIRKHKIFFNFNYRFSELGSIFKKYLESDVLGKILHISIISSHGFAFKQNYLDSWRSKNTHSLLYTLSIHYLDLLNYVLKDFKMYYFPKNFSERGNSFDTNFILASNSNGITTSILTSYSTCYLDEVLILGTNGFLTIRDNTLSIFSPRDSFDSNGLFTTPPIHYKNKFDLYSDYQKSLEESVNYFIGIVNKKEKIDLTFFKTSVHTCKMLFRLQNSIKET